MFEEGVEIEVILFLKSKGWIQVSGYEFLPTKLESGEIKQFYLPGEFEAATEQCDFWVNEFFPEYATNNPMQIIREHYKTEYLHWRKNHIAEKQKKFFEENMGGECEKSST